MLSDLRDNSLAIGVYLLVARLYLVSHAPIPLGRADVLAFDPSLKIGAVKRAFDRLLASGWLVGSTAPVGTKRHYTPSWGMVGAVARPWSLDAPALGRPRHVETVRVNRDLLDIGLGRITPHPRHAAEVTRYLAAPALGLADLGAYALMGAGRCHADADGAWTGRRRQAVYCAAGACVVAATGATQWRGIERSGAPKVWGATQR